MTFAKLAAQAIYPASDDEEARREDEEGRYSEWLKWAIGAGLLTAGAAAVFYNRDKIRESLGGRIVDSRTKLDAWLAENVGTTAGGIGGGVGLATAFGPGRKSRLFAGDMAEQSHLPGLGRKLMQTGDEHATKMQNLIGRWSDITGKPPQEVAAALGRLIQSAAAEGGEGTALGRLNRPMQELYAGYDANAPDPVAMVAGQKGNRLFDPSAHPLRSRSTRMGTPGTEMERILTNLDTLQNDTTSARASLNQHMAGGDFNTAWGRLSPQHRTALALEADLGRQIGVPDTAFEGGVLRAKGLDTGPLASGMRSAMKVKPKRTFWGTTGRAAIGTLAGSGIGTGINWAMGN